MMAVKRFLIVDDDDDSRDLIEFALVNANHTVSTASDGREGITKAELERPDVIILDLVMPEVDGLNVYQQLQNNPFTRDIPIIFMTAMVYPEILTQLKATQAIKVLTKPLNLDYLNYQIAKIFDWRSLSEVLVNQDRSVT